MLPFPFDPGPFSPPPGLPLIAARAAGSVASKSSTRRCPRQQTFRWTFTCARGWTMASQLWSPTRTAASLRCTRTLAATSSSTSTTTLRSSDARGAAGGGRRTAQADWRGGLILRLVSLGEYIDINSAQCYWAAVKSSVVWQRRDNSCEEWTPGLDQWFAHTSRSFPLYSIDRFSEHYGWATVGSPVPCMTAAVRV